MTALRKHRGDTTVIDEATAARLAEYRSALREMDRELTWLIMRRRATATTMALVEQEENIHDPGVAAETLKTYQHALGDTDGELLADAVREICRWPGADRDS